MLIDEVFSERLVLFGLDQFHHAAGVAVAIDAVEADVAISCRSLFYSWSDGGVLKGQSEFGCDLFEPCIDPRIGLYFLVLLIQHQADELVIH